MVAIIAPAAKVKRTVNRYWKKGLYDRSYIDRSPTNTIKRPSDAEIQEIYRQLHKFAPEDHLNCGACGYGCCESMAVAIYNGLNKPENCFHYERSNRRDMTAHLTTRLKESIGGIKNLGEEIEGIWEIVGIINSIASQTKIIAFNAELEASSAGEKGKNFEIVASEIRRLADNTVLSTQQIREKIKEIQQSSSKLVGAGQEESEKIREGWDLSQRMREVFNRLLSQSELSYRQTNEIINSQVEHFQSTLEELKALTKDVDRFNS